MASLVTASLAPAQVTPPAAQVAPPALVIGSEAPAIAVEAWLKGEPVTAFERGHVYVVEFWATWCGPCIFGMPHLTQLQARWAKDVTIIGVNIWEGRPETPYTDETRTRVAAFVAQNDAKMGYRVSYDGGAQQTMEAWMQAAGLNSIPHAFIVDGTGKIAYIGHPVAPDFEKALAAIVSGDYDLAAARTAYETRRDLEVTMRVARQVAERRLKAAVDAAMPHLRAGRHAEAVACCDTLDGVFAVLGADARDAAKVAAWRRIIDEKDIAGANAFLDYLLANGALTSGLQLSEIAWTMVDPAHPIDGADPERAVRCSTLALENLAPEAEVIRPAVLDTHARGLWLMGDRDGAIATQARAVELETVEPIKVEMQATLDEYRK